MNRLLILVIFLLAGMGQVRAQQIKFEMGKDSVFNAADDYAQTSEGFDVDITKKKCGEPRYADCSGYSCSQFESG